MQLIYILQVFNNIQILLFQNYVKDFIFKILKNI